jgi:hypothetical protein
MRSKTCRFGLPRRDTHEPWCILYDVVSNLYRPSQSAVTPAVMTCLAIHSIESIANSTKLGIRFESNLQEA